MADTGKKEVFLKTRPIGGRKSDETTYSFGCKEASPFNCQWQGQTKTNKNATFELSHELKG